MQKTIISSCKASLFVLLALSAQMLHAQANGKKVGVGIDISPLDLFGLYASEGVATLDFPSLLLVITPFENFRFEPAIGFFKSKREVDGDTYDSSLFSAGLGVFYLVPKDDFNLYGGLRASYLSGKSTYNEGDEYKSTGFRFAPTIGAEYFFNEHFSIGGEVGLRIASMKSEGEYFETNKTNETALSNKAALRFYF
jgi:hypothetical protein